MIINISTFLTHIPFGSEEYYNYDLRDPKRKIINPDKIKETRKTVVTTNDWSNIPYYPTTLEKKENIAKYLVSMDKQIPESLLKEISDGKKKELEEDSYNNFNKPRQEQEQNINIQGPRPPVYIQKGQLLRLLSQQQQQQNPPNKSSPQYAAYVGARPRAQASARIGMGGTF